MTRSLPVVLAVSLLAACGSSSLPPAGSEKPEGGTGPASPAPSVAVVEPTAQPTAEPVATAVAALADDMLGPLALGMADTAVEKALGWAEKKTPPASEEGATGDWVWSWDYSKQGLRLTMAGSSKSSPTILRSISATAPSGLRTSRGIGIGSTADEVRDAYRKELNAEESQADRLVAGSIFGGIIFALKGDRVTGIFYGAAAE